ncbi:NAD dependent epimerase/dehydratase [Colletotrichum salicis]|uniref:NAD dependent epimerase/dehydratase n=1 Tax=Colletotrichum salicis TaxID=1209931 RepID=A0A135V8V5_9PEZI|nr:NAD dependent epimerase/dehydratase [Colletotrichum salicis]
MGFPSSPPFRSHVLVTGATGFIGAHVVDVLLSRGLRVRGATRSVAKGDSMIKARPEYAGKLDFIQIDDFENLGVFSEAIKDVDAVVHVASVRILPINGVRSILEAAATNPKISRVVITSSFASVLDVNRKAPPYFTYTGEDWNPLTYEEAASPETSAVVAYRGSKKFAERAAWDFVKGHSPRFDIVTLCPPMTFGPVVHPVSGVAELNESNAMLWKVRCGQKPLPVARVPFWIDVRDLAMAHVEALFRPKVGKRRFVPAAKDRFSYGLAAKIIEENFDWAKGKVALEEQVIDTSHGLDGETAARELGFEYRTFDQTVVDLIDQVTKMEGGAI